MWIYLIFYIGAFVCDWLALTSKGKFFSLVFACIAIGLCIIALPLMIAPTTYTTAPVNIHTSTGNVTIGSYNQSTTAPQSSLGLGLVIGSGIVFIEFGFVILIIFLWITESNKKKYTSHR